MPARQYVEVEGQRLALTNLDKVLYPGAEFTKAHVIDYYTRISPWLLPHYARRPITMLRFPDGVRGEKFYEKDAPKFTPEFVHTTNVPRSAGGKPIRYICIDDLPTLVWCANLASLELHPFLHRADELNSPTSMVFDLDPGEGADLLTCAEVAFLLRDLLKSTGLECLSKVSGSKGLQLYVPLNTPVTYTETRAVALTAAQILERQHPQLIVSDMAKERRLKKVFIDWSQNSDFKTTIGVYSLRAKADVPYVSAPVSWHELNTFLKKDDPNGLRFTPDVALKRAQQQGDLFASLLTIKQRLAPASDMKATESKAPKSATPKFIEPMLLLRTNNLPEGKEWLYEIKLDGYRALAIKSNGKVALRSRNDNDFSTRYKPITRALEKMPDDTILDGEIVALDEEGRPSFNLLQNYGSSGAPLVFYVFDVPTHKGRDLTGEPLTKRRAILEEKVAPTLAEPVRLSPQLDASLADLIRSVKDQGFEGLVAKRKDSPYEPGQRSGKWQKMRVSQGQEFVIGGYTPSGKNFDALIIGYYENGNLLYVARTRNGFTPALRDQVFKKFDKLEAKTCPFTNLPEKHIGRWGQGLTAEKMKECRWLRPELVGEFQFVEWTPENHLRHSKFRGLREDKKAADVVHEG